MALSASWRVIVLSSEVNVTNWYLGESLLAVITMLLALNVFSNAPRTYALHAPQVTPDIFNVYFVSSACAVATKRPNNTSANFFITILYSRSYWSQLAYSMPTLILSPSTFQIQSTSMSGHMSSTHWLSFSNAIKKARSNTSIIMFNGFIFKNWYAGRDSNPRPAAYLALYGV